MQIHVYFKLDGIPGRETFETEVDGIISKYSDVEYQFWKKANEVGALTRTSGGNAWCQVDTLDGPTVSHYERVELPDPIVGFDLGGGGGLVTYYQSGKVLFE